MSLKIVLILYLIKLIWCHHHSHTPSAVIFNIYQNGGGVRSIHSAGCQLQIPSGYEQYGNSFYKYQRAPRMFGDAQRVCELEGGHLAIINSENEATFLTALMARYPSDVLTDIQLKDWVFIGFHDLFKEGDYVTIKGNSLEGSGFIRWKPGQPDNLGNNENCGSLHRSGGLNDISCRDLLPFICEIPIDQCNCNNFNNIDLTNTTSEYNFDVRFNSQTGNNSK